MMAIADASEQDRLEPCDVVMKGGITSGIVYPPALERLHGTHTFNSIGGTSAGAIAASMLAAAEYGRSKDGFKKFMATSEELQRKNEKGGGESRLFELFGAPKPTQPITAMLQAVGAFGGPGSKPVPAWRKYLVGFLKGFGSLAVHDAALFFPGALLGLALGALLGAGVLGTLIWLFGSLPLWLQALAATLWMLSAVLGTVVLAAVGGLTHLLVFAFLRGVPRNFYGIVTGHDPDRPSDKSPLVTDWLSHKIDHVAGLSERECRPLTFGQLCRRKVERNGKEEDAGITLRLVVTDVSLGRPYMMPFKDKERFLFNRKEMARLFPEYVVEHMVKHAYPHPVIPQDLLPQGYYFVPPPDDFPVVVAARMSFAIPLFFSAVPLYTIRADGLVAAENGRQLSVVGDGDDPTSDLQRNWFSDGGATSNFPIHSFDRWLPTRPTFGINLTAMPPAAIDKEAGQVSSKFLSSVYELSPGESFADPPGTDVRAVELPEANQREQPEWRPIADPRSFIMRVIDTARENRDNLLSAQPGYRERIVEVRFASDEGGMNLAMDPRAIQRIVGKGKEAGELLARFNFDHHRWTRFLVLMAQLEVQLQKFRDAFERGKYENLLLKGVDDNFPYVEGHNEEWRTRANLRAQQLVRLIDQWEKDQKQEENSEAGMPPPAAAAISGEKLASSEPAAATTLVDPGTTSGCAQESGRTIPNCDPLAAKITVDFFDRETPEPRPVLRVTPLDF